MTESQDFLRKANHHAARDVLGKPVYVSEHAMSRFTERCQHEINHRGKPYLIRRFVFGIIVNGVEISGQMTGSKAFLNCGLVATCKLRGKTYVVTTVMTYDHYVANMQSRL